MPHQKDRLDRTCIGADAGFTEWTGEKRHRSEVRSSSTTDSPPAMAGHEEDPFFTAADLEPFTITFGEVRLITNWMEDRPFIFVDFLCILSDESQRRVYERLMLYRLKAHKLSRRECMGKLDDETLRKELPDFLVKEKHIPQLHFDVHSYFKRLDIEEERGCVDWYFDPEYSKLEDLANYQRLVLKNHDDVEYFDWEGYRSTFTTSKMDKDYVTFFTEMSRKLQWLKKYIGTKGSKEWAMKTEIRGAHQALKIAQRFPGMTVDLAYTAYREHIWSLHYDYLYREGWDTVFFEIWKLVTREKLEFTHALMQVDEKHLLPQHDASILRFLKSRRLFDLESKFDSCAEDIPLGAGDGAAMDKIKKAVWNAPKNKMLHQYMERKMSIAEEIGLDKDSGVPRMHLWAGPNATSQVYA
uniref:Uncharacterized protein n=1 Tax=Avena sativa TaxID=4498 RepID=A0ACD5ZH11_AVESA